MLRGSSLHLPAFPFEKEPLCPVLRGAAAVDNPRMEFMESASPSEKEPLSPRLRGAEAEGNLRATPAPFEKEPVLSLPKEGLRGIAAVETCALFQTAPHPILSIVHPKNWTPACAGATGLSKLGRI
jgi:hypothetical protein